MHANPQLALSSASDRTMIVLAGSPLKALYALTISLSAFLLFEVQPLIGKIVLPQLGGAAAVWLICLLFFQTFLLLGYAYAHVLTRRLRPLLQRWVHVVLLAVSVATLPVAPRFWWSNSHESSPELHLLLVLALSIGLPYFLLSATSPLLQAWFTQGEPRSAPYRFYAISNAGSLIALLSYPTFIEPWVTTSRQAIGWSVVYVLFVLLCGLIAVLSRRRVFEKPSNLIGYPQRTTQLLWVLLAACGSALLLSVTGHLSQNIAPVPLLWIIPLSFYLLTFILCFEGRNWYQRKFFLRLLAVALGGMTYALSSDFSNLPIAVLVPLFCSGLFVCCMVCHGELARLKPPPEQLTSFYLMVSLGGALGALLVAIVAPHVFSGFYELHISLGACILLVLIVLYVDPSSQFYRAKWKPGWLGVLSLAFALLAGLFLNASGQAAGTRIMVRNFYGVLRVRDQKMQTERENIDADRQMPRIVAYRRLMNGTITHGLQFLSPDLRDQPTTYYSRDSGVGIVLRELGKRGPLRVGAIGLGAGTIAAYGRRGDEFTFYEINPLVLQLAKQELTFLQDSRAHISTVLGDARLSLESQKPMEYDLLVVDAFSGDAIPIHLLTREAFRLYFRHLKSEGLLLVHISNKHLNLEPVVAAAAFDAGREAVLFDSGPDRARAVSSATWIAVGRGRLLAAVRSFGEPVDNKHLLLWTDERSSLLTILK